MRSQLVVHLNDFAKQIDNFFMPKPYSYIRIMEDYFGEVYSFCPLTFTLPKERELFEHEHQKRSEISLTDDDNETMESVAKNLVPHIISDDQEAEKDLNNNREETNNIKLKPVWICKPVGKSQGKGICLIDNLTNLPDHPVTIVQEYIARPLLIAGYKFDLRLYVCIVSISPLTIYVYREGLTRFATEPYNLADLDRSYSHLTNSSINKLGPGYEIDKTGIGHGCKWTLRKLRQHLHREGQTDWFMWQRIMSIIVLTILGEVGQQVGISCSKNNFEFLGYDILIDTDLRPWLLETNLSPGLGGDCDVDEIVKKPMLHELFDLVGLPDSRPYLSLVPATAVTKANDPSIIDVDEVGNTALKITTEAELTSKTSNEGKPPSNARKESPPKTPSDEFDPVLSKIALEKSKLKNTMKTSKISWSLRKRLMDVSNIYSQKLNSRSDKKKVEKDNNATKTHTLPLMSDELSVDDAARLNFLASTDWVGARDPNNGTGSTIPHRPGIGLKKRCWYDAPARQGDWIRIYPFDYTSFQISRGHMGMDIKTIVNSMENFLETAEELVLEQPGLSDEAYGRKVRDVISWNRVFWYPPK